MTHHCLKHVIRIASALAGCSPSWAEFALVDRLVGRFEAVQCFSHFSLASLRRLELSVAGEKASQQLPSSNLLHPVVAEDDRRDADMMILRGEPHHGAGALTVSSWLPLLGTGSVIQHGLALFCCSEARKRPLCLISATMSTTAAAVSPVHVY